MNLLQRLGTVLGSVVTLVTALAVAVNQFIGEVVPALPDGWQDNALSNSTAPWSPCCSPRPPPCVALTGVPASQRGLLPTRSLRSGGVVGPSSSVRVHVEGSVSDRELVALVRPACP